MPERKEKLLPRTLASLANGGFPAPRLFVDGAEGGWESFGLPATYRPVRLRTFGNWWLAMLELWFREPRADRYAVFQDDLVCLRDLRQYLEQMPYPQRGYQNCFTFNINARLARGRSGWYPSDQRGLGAVALVFNRAAVSALLSSEHFVRRPMDRVRGFRFVDGGIVWALRAKGWQEYVHNPTLVQHTGHVSTTSTAQFPPAPGFLGEETSALCLVQP